MNSLFFSFKHKIAFVSGMLVAFFLTFSAEHVRATQLLEEDGLTQRGLRSLSIQEIDGQYYVVMADFTIKRLSFEDIKNHLDMKKENDKNPMISLKTSRTDIKKEMIKQLSPNAGKVPPYPFLVK